jgi:hypothetical protein
MAQKILRFSASYALHPVVASAREKAIEKNLGPASLFIGVCRETLLAHSLGGVTAACFLWSPSHDDGHREYTGAGGVAGFLTCPGVVPLLHA